MGYLFDHPLLAMKDARDFVEFALEQEVLKFGQFTLKSGRQSPYFFNAGLFNSGRALKQLGQYYARALHEAGVEFDMLYGPAYKGIPLATVTAIAYVDLFNTDIPVAYNRKEVKTHGEGGQLMGAPLEGRVVIIDDVITAGTAIRESMELIKNSGANVVATLVALDRQEQGPNGQSAIQEVEREFNIKVQSIASLADLIEFVENDPTWADQLTQLTAYRQTYGID